MAWTEKQHKAAHSPEARAKAVATMKARREAKLANQSPSDFQSKPSSGSPAHSAPSPLPPNAPRSAPGSLEEKLATALERMGGTAEKGKTTPPSKPRNEIPTDPDKRDKALASSRIMARIPVRMESELWELLGAKPYSEEEREELIELFAAVLYFYGVNHPLALLLLGHVAVATPRVAMLVRKRRAKRSGLTNGEVQGARVSPILVPPPVARDSQPPTVAVEIET